VDNEPHHIPKDDVEDVACFLHWLSAFDAGCLGLVPFEDAAIHALVDAGALHGDGLARRSSPLRWFAVDAPRDILSAYSKVSSCHIGLMVALE